MVCSAQQANGFEEQVGGVKGISVTCGPWCVLPSRQCGLSSGGGGGWGGIKKGVCLPPLVCSGRSMIDATPKGRSFFKMTCLSSDCLDVGVYRNHLHALRVLAR